MKCPYCNSIDVSEIHAEPNLPYVAFVISRINTSTNHIIDTSDLLVHVYRCNDCRGLLFRED